MATNRARRQTRLKPRVASPELTLSTISSHVRFANQRDVAKHAVAVDRSRRLARSLALWLTSLPVLLKPLHLPFAEILVGWSNTRDKLRSSNTLGFGIFPRFRRHAILLRRLPFIGNW
jgi:hypothetical protein